MNNLLNSLYVAEFESGRTRLAEVENSLRLKTVTTTDKIKKVRQMILDDRFIKVREITEAVGTPKERSLYEDLSIRSLTLAHLTHCELKTHSSEHFYSVVGAV